MNKKIWTSVLALLLTFTVVLAGCGKKESPKTALEESYTAASTMNSADFNMNMTLNLDFPESALKADPSLAMGANFLKNLDVTAKGVYQADPMQLEMTLEANLKGDMPMKISLPMVMTKDKMYVKVPNIPLLPIPKDAVGKYIVVDVNELNQTTEGKVNVNAIDVKKQQEFGQEAMKIFTTNFDEKTYFVEVDKKNAGLPESVDAKQIVKFQITNENLEPAIKTIVEKVAPQLLDLVSSDKYKDMLQVDPAEIEKAKKELAAGSSKEDTQKAIDELKKVLKINDFNILTAINKDKFPAYQEINANLDITEEKQGTIKIGTKIKTEYSNINKKANLQPLPTDTLTIEQFSQKMQASGM
ncbi:hypothetical protein [Paenibacillus chitinolyticus]|uniref:hypothetical protein n=1 Tax=Paenibacillus chitinolyticus TaxID=79263 RepID=UPI0036703B34